MCSKVSPAYLSCFIRLESCSQSSFNYIDTLFLVETFVKCSDLWGEKPWHCNINRMTSRTSKILMLRSKSFAILCQLTKLAKLVSAVMSSRPSLLYLRCSLINRDFDLRINGTLHQLPPFVNNSRSEFLEMLRRKPQRYLPLVSKIQYSLLVR